MINIFISYATEDRDKAESLFLFLKDHGFHPWMDKKNLMPGVKWEKAITDALARSDVTVFLVSSVSATKRGFFQREMKLALDKVPDLLEDDISVVPIRLDDCTVPTILTDFQWMDYFSQLTWNDILPSLALAAEQRGKFVATAETSAPIVLEYKETSEDASDGAYLFQSSSPKIVFPENKTLSQDINNILEGDISNHLLDFRKTARDAYDPQHSLNPSELQIHISPKFLSRQIISLETSVYWYGTGAAHGMSGITSTNIDVSKGEIFSINELLYSTEMLEQFIFSEISKIDDIPIASDEMIRESIKDNLSKKSFFEDEKMKCHFDQYEVFCYASGPFEIDIKMSAIKSGAFGKLTKLGLRLLDDKI